MGDCIFTYMNTIKLNHPWIGKYTVRPMDPMTPGVAPAGVERHVGSWMPSREWRARILG